MSYELTTYVHTLQLKTEVCGRRSDPIHHLFAILSLIQKLAKNSLPCGVDWYSLNGRSIKLINFQRFHRWAFPLKTLVAVNRLKSFTLDGYHIKHTVQHT